MSFNHLSTAFPSPAERLSAGGFGCDEMKKDTIKGTLYDPAGGISPHYDYLPPVQRRSAMKSSE